MARKNKIQSHSSRNGKPIDGVMFMIVVAVAALFLSLFLDYNLPIGQVKLFCESKGYHFDFVTKDSEIYCVESKYYCEKQKCILEREVPHVYSQFDFRKWLEFERDDKK